MDINNQGFWTDFIELYRANNCLWDVTCKDYGNKMRRKSSYYVLLNKFRELFPDGTIELLKKKINNIRTSFRRELKKVEDSKRLESETEGIYEPSLWYFDLLLFTAENERRGKSHDDDDMDIDTNHQCKEETDELLLSHSTTAEGEPQTSPIKATTPLIKPKQIVRKPPKQVTTNPFKTNKLALYNAAQKILSNDANYEDEFNVTGKRFAFQLKKLDDRQRLIAEKLWADIMFYGAQGKLELECTINFPSKDFRRRAVIPTE